MNNEEYNIKQTIILDKMKALAESLYITDDAVEKAKIEGKIEAYREILNTNFQTLIDTAQKVDKLNFLFSYDLSGKELDKYFGDNHTIAYQNLKNFFKDNGFKPIGDSEYITKNPITAKQYTQIEEKLFETFPWLELCAKKIISANYNYNHNIKARQDSRRTLEDREILKVQCSENLKENKVYKPQTRYKLSEDIKYDYETRNVHRVNLSTNRFILSNGKQVVVMPMNKNTFLCNYDTGKFQLKNTYDGIKLKGVVHFNEDILDDYIYIIRNYNELRLELLQEKTNANEYENEMEL